MTFWLNLKLTTFLGIFGLARIEEEFSLLLGRKVDLNTSKSLSHYFRSEVMEQAKNLYEKS